MSETTKFVRPHPFTRMLRNAFDHETGILSQESELHWRPGAWCSWQCGPDDAIAGAHGMGACVFEVHGEYQPPGFPTRTFYTMTFIDPDGREMKRSKLLNSVSWAFRKKVESIGFEYEVDPEADPLDDRQLT